MFISKKRFNERIKEAQEDVYKKVTDCTAQNDRDRYIEDRFDKHTERMNIAFADIDRRLCELERKSKSLGGSVVCCPKY